MRGMAGPTMVWLIEATSMPSMRAMKMFRVARLRPAWGALLSFGAASRGAVGVGAAVVMATALPFMVSGMRPTVQPLCSHCKIAVDA